MKIADLPTKEGIPYFEYERADFKVFTVFPQDTSFEFGIRFYQMTENGSWIVDGKEMIRSSAISSGTVKGSRGESQSMKEGKIAHEMVSEGGYEKFFPAISKDMEKEVPFITSIYWRGVYIEYSGRIDLLKLGVLVQDVKTGNIVKEYYIQLLGYCLATNCNDADLIFSDTLFDTEFPCLQTRIRNILDNADLFFMRYFLLLEKMELVKEREIIEGFEKPHITIKKEEDNEFAERMGRNIKKRKALKDLTKFLTMRGEEERETKAFIGKRIVRVEGEENDISIYLDTRGAMLTNSERLSRDEMREILEFEGIV